MMIANFALLVLAATVPAAPPRIVTLDEALATARVQHPLIHQGAAGTQAAAARADEALSPLLPQVSGNASYQRSTANFASRPGSLPSQISGGSSAASWNTYNYFNLGLSASQLLYDFGQSSSRWSGLPPRPEVWSCRLMTWWWSTIGSRWRWTE